MKRLYDISVDDIMDMIGEPHIENMSEMLVDRKTYIRRLEGLKFQLVENWCLVYYCSMYDAGNSNCFHWLSELRAHYMNLQKLHIKSKCSKHKVISSILIDEFDFNDPDQIYSIIEDKFFIEGVDNESIIYEASEEFAKSVHDLIDAISADVSFMNYIRNVFNIVVNV